MKEGRGWGRKRFHSPWRLASSLSFFKMGGTASSVHRSFPMRFWRWASYSSSAGWQWFWTKASNLDLRACTEGDRASSGEDDDDLGGDAGAMLLASIIDCNCMDHKIDYI